jgi:hypothetical protein
MSGEKPMRTKWRIPNTRTSTVQDNLFNYYLFIRTATATTLNLSLPNYDYTTKCQANIVITYALIMFKKPRASAIFSSTLACKFKFWTRTFSTSEIKTITKWEGWRRFRPWNNAVTKKQARTMAMPLKSPLPAERFRGWYSTPSRAVTLGCGRYRRWKCLEAKTTTAGGWVGSSA